MTENPTQTETTELSQEQVANSATEQPASGGTDGGAVATTEGEAKPNPESSRAEGDSPASGEEGQGDSQVSEEEEGSYEWKQKKTSSAAPAATEESEKKDDGNLVASIQLKLDAALVENEALKGRIKELETSQGAVNDPLIMAWSAHKLAHGDAANPQSFLKEIGAVAAPDTRNEEDILTQYFTDKAQSLGLNGQDLEEAVSEEMTQYELMSKLSKAELFAKVRKESQGESPKSIDQYIEKAQKQYNDSLKEQVFFAKRQHDLAHEFLNGLIESGKPFNGRKPNAQWKQSVMNFFSNSPMMFDTNFMILADPDENGQQDLFMPEVFKKIDAALHTDEIIKTFRSREQRARVENIDQRAEKAEQQRVEVDKTKLTEKEIEEQNYRRTLESMKNPGRRG